MSPYDLASLVLSGVIAVVVALHLTVNFRWVPRWARRGLAMIAGAIILTMAERLFPGSPFRDWAFVLLRLGLAILVVSLFVSARRPTINGNYIDDSR